jgi:multidrug efflux pump subunit AcrA (membrane-fusion protein)
VVDVAHLEIPIHIASSARSGISVGDTITVFRPGEDQGFATKISRISPVDDPATRTFAVYVEVNASDVDLAPGLFVRGEAVSSSEEFRTIIPRRAIRNQRVMLVEDGKMRTQSIVTAFNVNRVRPESGILDDEWAVLEENLPSGVYLVIEGSREIDEGGLVEIEVLNEDPERITP